MFALFFSSLTTTGWTVSKCLQTGWHLPCKLQVTAASCYQLRMFGCSTLATASTLQPPLAKQWRNMHFFLVTGNPQSRYKLVSRPVWLKHKALTVLCCAHIQLETHSWGVIHPHLLDPIPTRLLKEVLWLINASMLNDQPVSNNQLWTAGLQAGSS